MNCIPAWRLPFVVVNLVNMALKPLYRGTLGHFGFSGGESSMNDMSHTEGNVFCHALEISWASDVGRVRNGNEDNFACDACAGLVVLADGMGGCQAGEVASAIAVTTVMHELTPKVHAAVNYSQPHGGGLGVVVTCMCNAVNLANQAVFEAAMQESQLAGMGSTLVVAQFHDSKVTVANIGDSRLYLLRDHVLQQLTVDHTVLQEQIEYGFPVLNEAQRIAAGSMLTRALGAEPQITLDVLERDVSPGDMFLICSDGLYDMLSDTEMRTILLNGSEQPLEQITRNMVTRANEKGGLDNITLILVKVGHMRLTVS